MKAKFTLILLFALFLAPILVAVVLNSEWVDWNPAPERSHGELIDPVVPLPAFELQGVNGEALVRSEFAERWILMLVEPGACDIDCEERAFLMRQIRAAQNRHIPDIALVLLTGAAPDPATVERILALDPVFRIAGGPETQPLRAAIPDADQGGFYIVDPDGNIMERFGLDADPTGVRKDLRRLLTWTVRE